MNVELLGVNDMNHAAFNALATSGRILPWLQDSTTNSAWALWGVTYRDVRILDGQTRLHAVYNLTTHDLGITANKEALKALLLQAARFVDADGDQLNDDWEMLNFGNLLASPAGDWDSDGQDNFTEYAFGTSPTNATSRATFQTALIGSGANRSFELTYRRRAGSRIDYIVDSASVISPWTPSPSTPDITEPFRNLFDGTGTGWSKCTVPAPGEGNQFLRVRAVPRIQP